jgi:hypothetical protein
MITGYTTHKLDIIKSYTQPPFQIGVNGVYNIETDVNNLIESISYNIDGINFITYFYNTPIDNLELEEYVINYNAIQTLTTFFINTPPNNYTNLYNNIKLESELPLVFKPKIESNVFIDRNSYSVFENYYRMTDITSLDKLMDYKNGSFYKIII